MAERRQRARVQGGWAGAAAGKARSAASKAPVASSLAPTDTRPAWMRKDQPSAQKQFVFEKPSEVERRVPEAGVIDKPGVYELSKVPTGISRIHLIPGFIDSEQADWMFEQLLQDIPWGQRTHIRQGAGDPGVTKNNGVERHDMNTLSLPLNIRRGGSDTNLNFDVPDGVLEFHKVKLSADSLKQKILKVTEQIKVEQTARDGNVAEYLKLVNSADKQQAGRIRQVFEKKNQKSAHSIAQLQKKLEQYHKKLKDIEQNGSSKTTKDTSKDNLKDIQHGKSRTSGHGTESSKSGVPGVSLTPPVFVFSKSREFANLIRNKFGSADNIAHLKNTLDEFRPETSSRTYGGSATIVAKPKYVSDDECSSGTSGSADSNGNTSFGPAVASTLDSQGKLSMILEEIREIKETQSQLADDIENLKTQFKRDYGFISQMLQEERYRYERLEDQLNDLTDLHQHETANLKQELASIEEKVAYQAYERSRDVQEALESCQTRVSKLELHQQEQQAQQSETVNAKVLLGKCINVILAFMTVILVCVSTIAKFIAPMMKSRFHIICTFFAVTLLAIFCKNWDHIVCAIERMIIPR